MVGGVVAIVVLGLTENHLIVIGQLEDDQIDHVVPAFNLTTTTAIVSAGYSMSLTTGEEWPISPPVSPNKTQT